MRNRRYKTIDRIRFYRKGFSLIDTVAGMLILFIIVMGSLSYRYVSAANIQKSQQHLSAADLTTTFLETWQGVGGSDTFDPETTFASVLTISNGNSENAPSGYTLLGKYSVMEENIPYEVTLSWSDVSASLRALNVIVTWSSVNVCPLQRCDYQR
ncbi:MAG: type IV pilus modification PilV family protein [Planctomycetota bacterium]|jgi:Tfp pilus assembly protein PilV